MVLAERKRQTQLHRASAVLFSLDLEKRQLSVHMMTNSHLVSGPAAAPMRVIQLSIESVEIDAFVARPDLLTSAEDAIACTQAAPTAAPDRLRRTNTCDRHAVEGSAPRRARAAPRRSCPRLRELERLPAVCWYSCSTDAQAPVAGKFDLQPRAERPVATGAAGLGSRPRIGEPFNTSVAHQAGPPCNAPRSAERHRLRRSRAYIGRARAHTRHLSFRTDIVEPEIFVSHGDVSARGEPPPRCQSSPRFQRRRADRRDRRLAPTAHRGRGATRP